MTEVKVTLPDGKEMAVDKEATFRDIAEKISRSLGKAAIAGKKDGKLVDLNTPIEASAAIEIITPDSEEGLDIYRHSCGHILAQAMQSIFPEAKIGIGPAIDNGFYYDFAVEGLTPDDLSKIEKKMQEIIKADLPFIREEVTKEEAKKLFNDLGEDYKVELIEDLGTEMVSLYRQGDFVDLCRGPHVPSTGKIKAFKLLSIAGAYWRGDEK
ncbi:MAG: TGS domain-containing protein, partial [bacterium]